MYRHLRWLTIVVPVLGVAIFEILRFTVVPVLFPGLSSDGWGGSAILLLFVLAGGAIFSHGVFKIIDNQHHEIIRERQKLQSAFNYTSDGIIMVDRNLKILSINPAAEKITGWSAHEVIGKLTCSEINKCKFETDPTQKYCSEACLNPQCGHSQCWGKLVFERQCSIPYMEMCIIDRQGFSKPVAVSYSYIPGDGYNEPQVEIILRDITERKELEKAMHDMTVLEERYRLAREMHDGLAQTLCFLNLKCKTMENKLSRNGELLYEISEVKTVIQEALEEVRFNIFELKANPRLQQSFSLWLKDYGSKFADNFRIPVEVIIDVSEEWELSAAVKIHVTRIVQEALTNVRKHAQATKVTIELTEKSGDMVLTISDNGIGFVKEKVEKIGKKHFGLSIMEERAGLIGGNLTIFPNQPAGTTICLTIPIRKGLINGGK